MRDASAFDAAEFLGLARRARRDPYRLGLFARHLEPDEAPRAVLPVAGGTLVITDRRLLRLTSHLEIDGAWNVREFAGYTVVDEVPLEAVLAARREVATAPKEVRDALVVSTREGPKEFLLSQGPEKVVADEDAERALALITRSTRSRGPPA